jgi:hypothetical protein
MRMLIHVIQMVALAHMLLLTVMAEMHWLAPALVLALMGLYVIRYALESED